ncbi:DNA-binding protein, partial [Bacteroides uniformis]
MLLFYKPSEGRRQGTFEDGHHKIQKLIFMITIESLVEQGANVKLEVTPADLKMFAESIVQRTIMAQQEERDAAMKREAEETWLNTKQVREL